MIKNDSGCDCKCLHEKEVNIATQELKNFKLIDSMEIFYKAFADSTRLKIMFVLDKVGNMCVCDIAVSLNMTKSAISHQLKYLKDNNLVKSLKIGKEVMYSIADEHVKDIIEKGIEHLEEK